MLSATGDESNLGTLWMVITVTIGFSTQCVCALALPARFRGARRRAQAATAEIAPRALARPTAVAEAQALGSAVARSAAATRTQRVGVGSVARVASAATAHALTARVGPQAPAIDVAVAAVVGGDEMIRLLSTIHAARKWTASAGLGLLLGGVLNCAASIGENELDAIELCRGYVEAPSTHTRSESSAPRAGTTASRGATRTAPGVVR